MNIILTKLLEFFQENNGQMSNMRMNSTMVIVAGILYPYFAHRMDEMTMTYSLSLIGMGLLGKGLSKIAETKKEAPSENTAQ